MRRFNRSGRSHSNNQAGVKDKYLQRERNGKDILETVLGKKELLISCGAAKYAGVDRLGSENGTL